MRLRSSYLHGKAMYEAQELVQVRVQETVETKGLLGRLNEWCMKEKIYNAPHVHGTFGGGYNCEYYEPEDAKRVVAWLVAQGVEEGISDPKKDEEPR